MPREPVKSAGAVFVELESQASARGADRIGAAAVEGNRAAAALPAVCPVLEGFRPLRCPRRQCRHRRVVGRERRALGTFAPEQSLVLRPNLAEEQERRPGVGDQVVLIQVPPGPAFAEPDEHAVDELATERERPSAAFPAPPAEFTLRVGPRPEIEDRGRTGARPQDPPYPAAFMLHDPGPESIAAVGDPAPRLAEQIGAKLRWEDEGEGHVVQRALGIEPLPDPDLRLAVGQSPAFSLELSHLALPLGVLPTETVHCPAFADGRPA